MALNDTIKVFAFAPIAALLATLVLLFAFRGERILRQPLVIAMLAASILIQVFLDSALIGAPSFFELAAAAAINLFGFDSGAVLATVVGVLTEVPLMLLVVRVVNASRGWY